MLVIPVIFILLFFILLYGYKNITSQFSTNSSKEKISIITAARNEASVIEELISSVKLLDYPTEYFEFIIVDDNSTDETYSTVNRLIGNQINFKIIKTENKTLQGKRGALLKPE